jgi:hypothetical protein
MLKQRCPYLLVHLAMAGLFLGGFAFSVSARSQDSSAQSVAEAARRAREQKKRAKPVRTLTNEDIPPAPPPISKPAEAQTDSQKSEENAAPPATADTKSAVKVPANDEEAKQKHAENVAALERAKKELAFAERELNVLQRKAALNSEAYYSKPNFANDKEGKENLDAEAQQINDKQQAVDALKARVAELQALVGEPENPEPDKNPPNPPNM